MPYLTQDLPGIGGRIREQYEDFVVEEAPLYEPCGEGEHLYLFIEKRGIPTFEAVRIIAKQLGVKPRDIGYAGMKDAKAVTRQTLSVAGVAEAAAARIEHSALTVLSAKRHRNKLKLGHLLGNRFTIRIRGVEESDADAARRIMDVLAHRGAPNTFGEQRFGSKGDTHAPGREMLRGDVEAAVRVWLGGPSEKEGAQLQDARRLAEQREWGRAADAFPPSFRAEIRALRVLADTNGDCRAAFRSIPRELKRLFVSAYQSHLFNQLVAARLDELDRLWDGDLAFIHAKGAVFLVEDASAEQPRCDALEISPSGPLYGRKLKFAEGRMGAMERGLLTGEGLTLDDFKSPITQGLRGARRPLRFPVEGVDMRYDDGVVLSFSLPKGCYATTVLREVMKTDDDA